MSSLKGSLSPRTGLYLNGGKRIVDFLLSLSGLVLLSPIFLVVSCLVRISSPGPILYRQRRIGRNGMPFWILKFRSMRDGADQMGGSITPANDPRVTAIGSFLRKWKLDELPQLWNVLKGDMSFVGPRPEIPAYVAGYSDEQRRVLNVRPGITDLASLRYRDEGGVLQRTHDPDRLYREEILPHKLSLNLQYLQNVSFAEDISLIVRTLKSVVAHSQAEEKN
jgi:lipopolysaccharide/colanic/teichoic acid biosynthesis glycosyltransferase